MVYCGLLLNQGKSGINLKILYIVVEIINWNIKVVGAAIFSLEFAYTNGLLDFSKPSSAQFR